MTNNKKVISVAVAVFVGGWLFATPYIAANSMESAIASQDAEKIAKYVDFPVLKENIKQSMNDAVLNEAAKAGKNDPAAQMGAMLAAAFVGPMVDAMISPKGLAMMIGTQSKPGEPPKQKSSLKDDPDTEISQGYNDLNTFAVDIKDKPSDKTVSLIFKRSNLYEWKLSNAVFPTL